MSEGSRSCSSYLVPSFFRSSFEGTPLPWSKLFPVMLLIACESFNGLSIFAYVGTYQCQSATNRLFSADSFRSHSLAFMVRDFGLVGPDDTERAGYALMIFFNFPTLNLYSL